MGPTYNMKDLSVDVADKFGLTATQGNDVVRFVFDKMKAEVAAGKQVRMHRCFTLEARERAAGVARNPMTGARLTVPAHRVVKMTVSPAFKAKLTK